MLKQLRNYLITGLIALLPLIATIYIILTVINTVDSIFSPLVKVLVGKEVYGLGFILTFLIILGVGIVAKNMLGKKLIDFGESILGRIPLVRNIYTTIRQIINSLFLQNKTAFRKVVLIEYPRKGIYQLGFLTCEGIGEVQEKTAKEVVNIFIPTTPNPTSGMLILVPREEVTYLDMSVEEGLKLIVSGGTLAPRESIKEDKHGN
ncbi:DUF502 domain-containing protein [Orenia marismortui]|uniref:DUF502 domain-containing protein n=1 Tax=Orenia marismortui TaxID=46469 RepID=UPI00037F602F|nr:DUF502 domain-containing protein [Orenia marismortui]